MGLFAGWGSALPTVLLARNEDGLQAQACFRAAGFTVISARNSDHALRLCRDYMVDVAVLDDPLADCGGIALAMQLKELRPALQVVIVVGKGPIGDELARADAVISSHSTPEELLHRAQELIARRAAHG